MGQGFSVQPDALEAGSQDMAYRATGNDHKVGF